jgi:hypothetical protein
VNLGHQVHDKDLVIFINAEDLVFEDHYLLNISVVRRMPQPRVTTNTPKEMMGSGGEHEM